MKDEKVEHEREYIIRFPKTFNLGYFKTKLFTKEFSKM